MNIQVTGMNGVLAAWEKYADIEAKLKQMAERLCEIGRVIVLATHGNHATVYVETTDKGWAVVAEGPDVLFIEFGTGDAAGREAGRYDKIPAKVRPGSWSEKHAQMYSRYGFWVFAGHIIHETRPHPAFYEAYRQMVEAIPQVVSEVFK